MKKENEQDGHRELPGCCLEAYFGSWPKTGSQAETISLAEMRSQKAELRGAKVAGICRT